jgi:hypothetical protein
LACYAKKNCKIKFRNHTGEGSGDGEGMQRSLANSISVSAQAKTTLSATKERLPQGKR